MIVQVVEATQLPATSWAGTSDPYIELQYDQATYRTRTVFTTRRPIWNETFVLAENSSLLTRRVRLEVWDSNSGSSRDKFMGFAAINLDQITENAVQVRHMHLASGGVLRQKLPLSSYWLAFSALVWCFAAMQAVDTFACDDFEPFRANGTSRSQSSVRAALTRPPSLQYSTTAACSPPVAACNINHGRVLAACCSL